MSYAVQATRVWRDAVGMPPHPVDAQAATQSTFVEVPTSQRRERSDATPGSAEVSRDKVATSISRVRSSAAFLDVSMNAGSSRSTQSALPWSALDRSVATILAFSTYVDLLMSSPSSRTRLESPQHEASHRCGNAHPTPFDIA
jgi:hypothetical protein